MIKLERFEVMNMNNAIRGARNPLNSWARMDSYFDEEGKFVFGPNDLDLAKRLCKAGSDHRKFIRQIFVTVDITAPLYWWKEYDTYKVGTVANSTSTMHKIHSKPFEMSDFSTDHMTDATLDMMQKNIDFLEGIRTQFVETKDKALWYSMIQLLPESYNQNSHTQDTAVCCNQRQEYSQSLIQSRRNFLQNNFHHLNQCRNDKNKCNGLQITQSESIEHKLLDNVSHNGSQRQHKGNSSSHTHSGFYLLRNAQERTDTEKL